MTPRRMLKWSTRLVMTTGPLALLTFVLWAGHLLPEERPFVVLMAYQGLLLLTVGAGCVAAVSGVQVAIHDAFSAGFKTGQASVDPRHQDPLADELRRRDRGDADPLLRLVD